MRCARAWKPCAPELALVLQRDQCYAPRPVPFAVAVERAQLLISTYGGYFGGGMGIMMLATMALAGMTNIHEMNGLKSFLGVAINGFALATFIITGTFSSSDQIWLDT